MTKILGTDDSVNSCECCGKSGLKYTVVVEINGEIMHYGSTCATKHTGMKSGQIKKAIEVEQQKIVDAAKKEFHSSVEFLQHQAKLAQLNHDKTVRSGKEFHNAQKDADIIATSKKREIATKYSLQMYDFF